MILIGIAMITFGYLNFETKVVEFENASLLYNDNYIRINQMAGKFVDPISNKEVRPLSLSEDLKSLQEKVYSTDTLRTKLSVAQKKFDQAQIMYYFFCMLGILLVLLGIFLWHSEAGFERSIMLRQNIDKPLYYKNCQSCSRNFNSMINYSRLANLETCYSFCEFCYKDGKFCHELSKIEFKDILKEFLIDNHYNEVKITGILSGVDKVERWGNQR